MELVVYRETRPGILLLLREAVVDLALESLCDKLETLKGVGKPRFYRGKTATFAPFIRKDVAGYDDISLRAVIGIVYEVPDQELNRSLVDWAFEDLFDFLSTSPGTWDLDYRGETTDSGFAYDFRLHKSVPLNLSSTERNAKPPDKNRDKTEKQGKKKETKPVVRKDGDYATCDCCGKRTYRDNIAGRWLRCPSCQTLVCFECALSLRDRVVRGGGGGISTCPKCDKEFPMFLSIFA
ncbi:MAG: hypothetical protein KJ963_02545 [Bacteroidetes bacterium]|nr:hypothetical protein [Bacteroidota bacterium]MBU1423960.1 hypothetical protein [Bacteroidota bacterium]MBU2635954.1 hypothetical protein [Bacteroidota bacterium]